MLFYGERLSARENELRDRIPHKWLSFRPWKLFLIYSWFCVILRVYVKDATLLVGYSGVVM